MRVRPVLFAVVVVVAATVLPGGPFAVAATPPTHESYSALRHQIESAQVRHARINRKAHSVTVTLVDGRRERALYPSRREPELAALLHHHHATVTQVRHHHARKARGHRLRYIALGVVVLLGVAVAAYLLLRRRRNPTPVTRGPTVG